MKIRVVIVRDKNVWIDDKINTDVLNSMLVKGILNLTNLENEKEAWQKYFLPNEKIAIKVNTITEDPAVSTHSELALLVCDKIIKAGIRPNDITVYDRGIKYFADKHEYNYRKSFEAAGYKINTSEDGIKIYEATEFGDWQSFNNIKNRFFNVLKEATGHINMPILKNHHIMGVTFALKNHVGSVSNPELFHKNAGVPGIGDLNSMPEIKNTLRLVIGDLLKCQFNNGPHNDPEFHWNENAILLSNDPVAADTVAFEILKQKRLSSGIPNREQMKYGGIPGEYIKDADLRCNLGTSDLQKIELIEINN